MSQPTPEVDQKHAGVVVPPPVIYAGVLVLALAIDALFGGPSIGLAVTPRMILAGVLLVAGFAIPLIAAAQFRTPHRNQPGAANLDRH